MTNLTGAQTGRSGRLLFRSLFVAAACAGAAAMQAQTPAAAAPAAPPVATPLVGGPIKIGIIEAQVALVKTKDGQAAQAEMEKKLGPKAQGIQKDQQDLNDLQRKLDQGGNTMSAAAKTELQNTIQTRSRTVQREIQDFQDEQQAEEGQVLAVLEEKMKDVISKYAVENNFTIIFNVAGENSSVLWATNAIDITQAIIDAYDKAAPLPPKATAPAATKQSAPPPAAAPKPTAPATSPAKPPATGPH